MASTTAPRTAPAASLSADAGTASVPVYQRPRMRRHVGSTTEEMTRNSYIQSGRENALRAFYEDLTTLDGDAQAALTRVLGGPAPQAYKDSFAQTLMALAAMFDTSDPEAQR